MTDLQAVRKRNLRALIRQWDGPTNLAKKLRYSGPSYLSQLIGSAKPITEKTARTIESALELPVGWLDADRTGQVGHVGRLDTALVSRAMLSVSAALEDAGVSVSPARMAGLVGLVYEHAFEHQGEISDEYTRRIVKLLQKE